LCATRLEALRPYLGKEIDIEFLREMRSISVDPCGEKGEFHTFVYDGPIFKKRLLVEKGEEICKDGFYFLDVRLLEG
jgi:diphthamide synthase (EF-2-diphthine--ammonia ligase)